MQAEICDLILKLKEENQALYRKMVDNDRRIQQLESQLYEETHRPPPLTILTPKEDLEGEAWGEGEPPVPGAIPAHTYRDKDGVLQIALCKTYGGDGWIYTAVADGWVTITREDGHV